MNGRFREGRSSDDLGRDRRTVSRPAAAGRPAAGAVALASPPVIERRRN